MIISFFLAAASRLSLYLIVACIFSASETVILKSSGTFALHFLRVENLRGELSPFRGLVVVASSHNILVNCYFFYPACAGES